MRNFTADFIFPISQSPLKNGVVSVNDDGTIAAIHPNVDLVEGDIEYHQGIICPGFVNAHCHLELSHMKGQIPEQTGLPEFAKRVVQGRDAEESTIENAIKNAEGEMLDNGIVAVGDICNMPDSFAQKAKGNLRYYSFLEAFDFIEANTEKEFEKLEKLHAELMKTAPKTKGTIVPHAPYSVTPELFKKILEFNLVNGGVISMHNQETEAENEMFIKGKGELLELFESLGMDFSTWRPTGFSSLKSTLTYLPKGNNILLIHNSKTTGEDIEWAQKYSNRIWWCFCPNANLYIENQLPDYKVFTDAKAKIVLGTDSLASNHQLSILEEMKVVAENAPFINEAELFRWATLNGAQALEFDGELGSLEAGKKPGLNLVENIERETGKITAESTVRRLI